jgi:lysophospholipase L1-like esterase
MRLLILVLALAFSAAGCSQSSSAAEPQRFASEIANFAAADRAQPAPSCAVLFVGSSTIRLWRTLSTDMAPYPVINRGFGGAVIADVNFYFDQLVRPYRPRAIVFYAGENDLAGGASVSDVMAAFARFMDLKTRALGAAPVYFISVKPSRQRWTALAQQAQLNAAVRRMAAQRPDLRYVDVADAMLQDGRPRPLFVADGLHLNAEGYALWTSRVRPLVARSAAACNVR